MNARPWNLYNALEPVTAGDYTESHYRDEAELLERLAREAHEGEEE